MNIRYMLLFLLYTACNQTSWCYKDLHPDVLHALKPVLSNIYHLSAQEVQDIVKQDVGPIMYVTAQELHAKMEQASKPVVVNVLTQKWYDDCHIQGSINISLKDLIYVAQTWDKDQEIIVYCALDECDASQKAYILLRCMGFQNVADYQGGIKEWFNLGLPIVGPCAASYLHDDLNRVFEQYAQDADFQDCLVIKKIRLKPISEYIANGI